MQWKGVPIPSEALEHVVALVVLGQVRKAISYVNPTLVITATRRLRPDRRSKRVEVVVTIGSPNFEARQHIKKAQKAGLRFPFYWSKYYPLSVKNKQ